MIPQPLGAISTFLALVLLFSSPITAASITYSEDTANDPYFIGKIIYHRKLACPRCPLADKVIDASIYKSVIESLKKDARLRNTLNNKERSAVTYYLETLFAPR